MSKLGFLALACAMMAAGSSPHYILDKPTGKCADHSKNIKPYHEKPVRKGAGERKLSRKQRKLK